MVQNNQGELGASKEQLAASTEQVATSDRQLDASKEQLAASTGQVATSTGQLAANATLDEVRQYFCNDKFATTQAGCMIREAAPGRAVCSMQLCEKHLNAQGYPMGGAIFTLADFALAVACNIGEAPTVAASNTIDYLCRAKGNCLIATAKTLHNGRRLAFYQVDIHDEQGIHVATMSAKCYRGSRLS